MIIKVDKEKVLKEFEEKYVKNRYINEYKNIQERYRIDGERIREHLFIKFDSVCKKTILYQEKGLKGEIEYIYVSLLRTSLIENKGEYRIDLYDENWFLDKEECSININLDFIYEPLFNHMKELSDKKNEYGRTIKEMDIENIKLREAKNYHVLALELLKTIIEEFVKIDSYKNIKKKENIRIMAGEYMDITTRIYPKNQKNDV